MRNRIKEWWNSDSDLTGQIYDYAQEHDSTREEIKKGKKETRREIEESDAARKVIQFEQRGFYRLYTILAVISCITLIGVLLYTVAGLPNFGEENPRTAVVTERYIEEGVEETGAVNVVAGMILDYRAFDTLGESHVLFTALVCVTILLRMDKKNMRKKSPDSYYTLTKDSYFDISPDNIIKIVGMFLLPCILVYGIYVILNGQNGPGGGFSGGAVLGAGLIIFACAFGFEKVDTFFTGRVSKIVTFVSLSFYSFAKGYVFFTGANGINNHIPKGIPGAILSGGMILPLDIAVGLVVACTMYGFYSLFKRGNVGHD